MLQFLSFFTGTSLPWKSVNSMCKDWNIKKKRSTSASKVIFLFLWVAAGLLCAGELHGDQLVSHISKKQQTISVYNEHPAHLFPMWSKSVWLTLDHMAAVKHNDYVYTESSYSCRHMHIINCFIPCVIVYTNLSLMLEHYRSSLGSIIVFICLYSCPFLFYLKAFIVIERLKRRGGEKLRMHHRMQT